MRARALCAAGCLAALTTALTAAAAGPSLSPQQLALMPLPRAALRAGSGSLPLDQDSGVISDAQAARSTNGLTSPATLAKLGRVSGYALDYGTIGLRASGVFEVQSSVELYKTTADATSGLAFWRRDSEDLGLLKASGVSIVQSPIATGGLGAASFGFAGSITVKGKRPFYGAQIMFQHGPLLGEVSIDATSAAALQPFAATTARALAARIDGVVAGRISGPAVALPAAVKAGPPPHGPNLAALALSPSDLGTGKVGFQGYELDTSMQPISEYGRVMSPGGPFAYIQERVALFQDPTEASYRMGAITDILGSSKAWEAFGAAGAGISSFHPTAVAVHAGDESHAAVGVARLMGGSSVEFGFVVMRTGSVIEIITVASPVTLPIPASAMAELARIAAARTTRGLHQTAAKGGLPVA